MLLPTSRRPSPILLMFVRVRRMSVIKRTDLGLVVKHMQEEGKSIMPRVVRQRVGWRIPASLAQYSVEILRMYKRGYLKKSKSGL